MAVVRFKQKEDAHFYPSTPYAISHSAIDYHLRCLGKNYNFPYIIGDFQIFMEKDSNYIELYLSQFYQLLMDGFSQ